MKFFCLKSGLKLKLWYDENYDYPDFKVDGTLIEKVQSLTPNIDIDAHEIILELFVPRDTSYYGLLGLTFIQNKTDVLEIKTSFVCHSNMKYEGSLSYSTNNVFYGILEEYASSIMQASLKKSCELHIPPGILEIKIGSHDEVGSSIMIFKILVNLLIAFLIRGTENLTEESLEEIYRSAKNIL